MARLTILLLGDQHARQPDRDAQVAGQLEHAPVRLVGLVGLEERRHRPLLVGQVRERVGHAPQLALERVQGLLVRRHRPTPRSATRERTAPLAIADRPPADGSAPMATSRWHSDGAGDTGMGATPHPLDRPVWSSQWVQLLT